MPILNRPELLAEMMKSVGGHHVERIVVIDNGNLFDDENRTYSPAQVISPGHNLGVAASWNLGIRSTPWAPWWLITNHDITFGEGDLARLEATLEPGSAAVYHLLGFAAFALTRHTINAIGLFDENFVNGYDEDVDYARRCELGRLPRIEVGFSGTHVGSATLMADPALRAWNGNSHAANDRYYAQKWGGQKQGGETFDTPFDRGGHLGDWKADFERYRNQTWPRR